MKTQKQRIFSILAILTMAVILTCTFAACDKVDAQDSSFKVTIHPNNGQDDIVWDVAADIPSITKDVGAFRPSVRKVTQKNAKQKSISTDLK